MKTIPVSADRRTLLQNTGWVYWPIAFLARLPFAMMTVGVLMLVVAETGSVGLGGVTSAATGIGIVIAGPLIGDLVDRHGQRRVLVPLGIANGILLALFAPIVMRGMPPAAVLAAAFAIGITAPQAAAMSRSRLLTIIAARLSPSQRVATTNRVMSYESAADETAFVIGPFLVGIAAAFIAPWAPIAIAAALSAGFVTAFAVHPTARIAPRSSGAGARSGIRAVFSRPILVLAGATLGVGAFFGSTLTSLTAFVESTGGGTQAGLLYALLGMGSAVLALGVSLLPARIVLRVRWVVFAAVLTAAAVGYATAAEAQQLIVWLLVMGLGVGPTLVTLFSLAAVRAPLGRTATTMTVLGSALTLAQALASALTGWVAQEHGAAAVMVLPALAAASVLALGVVNVVMERRSGWRSVVSAPITLPVTIQR